MIGLLLPMGTSALLMSLGDVLAQLIVHFRAQKRQKFLLNIGRVVRIATWAALVFAPLAYLWYWFLDSNFSSEALAQVLIKVALDQLPWSVFINALFFFVMSLLERKTFRQAAKRVQESLWSTLLSSWLVWPAVQLVNLGFVPRLYQVSVVNVVSIPWSAYLAMQANADEKYPPHVAMTEIPQSPSSPSEESESRLV
jgi:hypothetical protein